MAGFSDRFVGAMLWSLVKKLLAALCKNWLDLAANCYANIAIYTLDLLTCLLFQPFRDKTVWLSQVRGMWHDVCVCDFFWDKSDSFFLHLAPPHVHTHSHTHSLTPTRSSSDLPATFSAS